MARLEIPSDAVVVEVLKKLGDEIKAVDLCSALIQRGHSISESQLAIQRAAERGRIVINANLTLSARREAVAA